MVPCKSWTGTLFPTVLSRSWCRTYKHVVLHPNVSSSPPVWFCWVLLLVSCPQQLNIKDLWGPHCPPSPTTPSIPLLELRQTPPLAFRLGLTSTSPPPVFWDSWQNLDRRPLSLNALGKQVNERSKAHWPLDAGAYCPPPRTLSQRSVIQNESLCCWKAEARLKCHIPQGLCEEEKIHQSFSFINY